MKKVFILLFIVASILLLMVPAWSADLAKPQHLPNRESELVLVFYSVSLGTTGGHFSVDCPYGSVNQNRIIETKIGLW